ncbi:MAG: flagellar hook-length control protein FliK, partial [Pseudomonadota bacterium]
PSAIVGVDKPRPTSDGVAVGPTSKVDGNSGQMASDSDVDAKVVFGTTSELLDRQSLASETTVSYRDTKIQNRSDVLPGSPNVEANQATETQRVALTEVSPGPPKGTALAISGEVGGTSQRVQPGSADPSLVSQAGAQDQVQAKFVSVPVAQPQNLAVIGQAPSQSISATSPKASLDRASERETRSMASSDAQLPPRSYLSQAPVSLANPMVISLTSSSEPELLRDANSNPRMDGTMEELSLHTGTSASAASDGSRSVMETRQASQVALQLTSQARPLAEGVIEIALKPEELGRVRMLITLADGALQVSLAAERPETADLMRRNLDILAQDFRELGYQDVSFDFGTQSQQHQQDDVPNTDKLSLDEFDADVLTPVNSPSAAPTPDGRVDIRF